MATIHFSRYFKGAWILSTVVFLSAMVFTLSTGGFRESIDFTSGFMAKVILTEDVPVDVIRGSLNNSLDNEISIQQVESNEVYSFIIKGKLPEDTSSLDFIASFESMLTHISEDMYPNLEVNIEEVSFIDPSFSSSLVIRTIWLVVIVLFLILLYIWFRFRLAYAAASILGLIHNIFLVVSLIGVFHIEISITVIVSILTMVGYSLNDTIVVFDRIRENVRKEKNKPFRSIIDESLTQTLSRTIVTSVTTFTAILMIAIFTSGEVKDFANSFIIGIFVGNYSSIFIASSLLYCFYNIGAKRVEKKEEELNTTPSLNISFKK